MPTPSKKPLVTRKALYVFSLVAFSVCLFLFIKTGNLRLSEFLQAAKRFDVKLFSLALVASLFQILFQICRLWVLKPAGSRVPWLNVARGFSYGQTINSFVPLRAGDVMKVIGICSHKGPNGVNIPTATGMLIADKLVDILSFILWCVGAGILWLDNVPTINFPNITTQIIGAGVLILLVVGLIYLLPHPRFQDLMRRIRSGFAGLGHPRTALISLSFSLLGWCAETTTLFLLLQAQDCQVGFSGAVWTLAVLNLGIAVPISFANLGPFEASMVFGLGQLGVAGATALAIASAHHAIQIAVVLIWAAATGLTQWFQTRISGRNSLNST